MTKKIMSSKHLADLQKSMQKSSNSVIYAPLSKSVCAAMLAGAMVLGGGVFVSPAPAYADGYVAPDGNIYYGYKSDANYSKDRIKIEVHYYSSKKDAEKDDTNNQDPLGKYVHVKYTANLNSKDNSFDKWAFRPMWWYGVPSGLTNVHNIEYSRFEDYTAYGKPSTTPSTSHGPNQDSDNVTKHYKDSKDWKSISRFYVEDPSQLKSMNGLGMLLGIDDNKNNGYDSNGTSAGNWKDFYAASKGMRGMFIDWESAGKRFYEMDYVAELTDDAWQKRDEHPLRFAAGVYRFAGNWHIATGQIHRAPKIADSLKVAYPSLTPVAKADALNDTEKTSVKDAIKTANKDTKHFNNLLEKIDVADDGTATLTFHDKTTIKMPGKLLVVEEKKDNVKFPPVYPAPMGVVNPQKLSTDDQNAIIAAFKKENAGKDFLKKVSTTDSDVYKFDNNKQELTITYTDGSKITVPYSSLVYQGAKIADWAPYVVPDPIPVKNLSSLDATEQNQVTDAFDAANADLDVYNNAKKNGATPVSFDKDFKNAIITWADGSTSTIPSWQFLKQKAAEQKPTPDPSTPKPAEKKTFTVDLPPTPGQVIFDPFDKTATVDQQVISSLENQLKKRTAKDANDPSKSVDITSAKISIADGTVTFKADGYADKVYPIGIFYKKKVTGSGTQNPTQQTPTSKTDTDPDQAKNTFTYNVRKMNIAGNKATPQEAAAALKQFVKDNYDNVDDSDFQNHTDSIPVLAKWKPKSNTKNMGSYDATGANYGPMVTISLDNGYGIKVTGHPWLDGDDSDWDSAATIDLITISANDLYAPNSGSQTPTDNTIDQLKALAKQIRDKRKNAGELADADITTLKATDKDIDGMNDEKALRDLIKKISDYQKPKPVEYKYNFEKLTLDHEGEPNDADYKKIVVEQFLKKNYTTNDWSKLENAYSKSATVLSGNNANTYGLTPVASGTSGLNIYTGNKQTGSVTSVGIDSNGDLVVRGWKAGSTVNHAEELIRIKKADLYTPKSKDQNPTPSTDELNELRKQAKELIDRNPNLTPEQKTKFKGDIDGAKDKPAILKILNDAKNQGNTNKNNTSDPEVQRIINNNKGGGDEKKQHELQAAKDAAKKAIDNLLNLTPDEKNALKGKVDKANDVNGVNGVVDEAKKLSELNTVKKEAKEAKLYFLDHGKGADADSSDSNHDEDAALNELLGTKPAEDSALKTLAEKLKANPASASEISSALEAAKRANAVNEQNAKNAGIAKLEAKKAELDAAYNALSADDKNKAKSKYDDAIQAINDAKTAVNNATKPSDIKKAVDGVDTKIEAANNDIKTNTPKRDTTGNTNDPDATTFQSEKDKAKKEIDDIPGLTEDEKNDYKDQIDHSTHKGDPEAIVNQAKKHKKIEAALKAIDDFKNLNNAQKEAFKRIIEDTDASDHKNADGTTSDDIDDALANAANTDNAMARLEELEKKANALKGTDKYTGNSVDPTKKAAFDKVLQSVDDLLNKDKGDAKGAPEVNDLYTDLLNKMRDLDPNAQSAGLKTDALRKEIESDKTFKPDTTANPATPGDPVYNTSSKEKKDEFDKALGEAKTVLSGAANADTTTAEKEAAEQKEIDAALDKLVKARLALDGVDTTDLQKEIDKESATTSSDAYKYDSQENQNNYNKALQEAKDLIDKLTGKKQAGTDDHLDTKENKQKALDKALQTLKDAAAALDGKKPVEPTPTPTPTPSVDKSHLQQGIDNGSDVHNSDEYNNAPSDKKQAYDHALDHANEVNNDPNATQDQVNQAAEDLKKAENDLKPTPSPLPSPVPGGAGFGVNDNAPTTVDKGELNVQIDSAEADSQPGNAGNGNAGNAGNTNSGNAANNNANTNAANANSAAVNAAVENSPAVKQADAQVSKAQTALDSALAEAKKVAADPNATQAQVDAAAQKLSAARKALASAKAHAAEVRASVRAQVLKSGVSKLSKTGSNVSVFGLFAAVAAAGAAFFVTKRRGTSRHSNN
ncbi:sugar-binding protein [Gardnerella greenwoodii]|uniref:sugar-binding protein n=1 Tax=Gardnerella greenwoodii TaxID=2914925 RepID=UPI0039EE4861